MNFGIRGWARPRNKRFVGVPQVIDSTNGNTFYHGFGRIPGNVVITLRVKTTANGYTAGHEIPIDALSRQGVSEGTPRHAASWSDTLVRVLIPSTNIYITDATGALATPTLSNYLVVVRCDDIERLI